MYIPSSIFLHTHSSCNLSFIFPLANSTFLVWLNCTSNQPLKYCGCAILVSKVLMWIWSSKYCDYAVLVSQISIEQVGFTRCCSCTILIPRPSVNQFLTEDAEMFGYDLTRNWVECYVAQFTSLFSIRNRMTIRWRNPNTITISKQPNSQN